MKHILLDLGGVVFQSTGKSSAKIDWTIISSLNHKYGHQLNLGEDLFPQFLKEYNQETGLNLEGQEFLKEIFDTLSINQELIDFLSQYGQIHILSDNYRENIAYISERYDFASWSVNQFYSFQYGMTKGETAFFERIINDVRIATESLLFIDDDSGNIQRAKECGIQGICFRNNEQFIRDFEGL